MEANEISRDTIQSLKNSENIHVKEQKSQSFLIM